MLNIVVPMAGRGSRFAIARFKDPKPLIPVHGVPMIRLVIENLKPNKPHRFIFICQASHVADYALRDKLAAWAEGSEVIQLEGVTEGAACTVLAARDLIDNDDELMIVNSDQYVNYDINAYLNAFDPEDAGLIMTMTADDPKWSFVGFDDQGNVNRVVEKEVISNEATVGVYNYRRGRDFVRAAEAMIAADDRVNGEFYVAPVYNYMIRAGQRVAVHTIGSEADGMYGLGIPEDLDIFLKDPVSDFARALA